MKVTICIPTHNEAENITSIIEGSRPYADELLVIDGHSTDQTREIAQAMGIRVVLDRGKGKGDGVRIGIQEAAGDVIVFIDADGSHNPEDIPRLLEPIRNDVADLVIGSRMYGGSDELHGDINKFIRVTGSHIITLGINYRFNVRLTDSQNGFRAIRTELARKLELKEDITTIEQEMIIKVLHHKGRIAEVPAHEYRRRFGNSSIIVRKVWLRYVYCWLKGLIFP